MAQWKIGGRQALCSMCSHSFADGERHHSMVQIRGEEILRLDGCQACWDREEFGPQAELVVMDGEGDAPADPEQAAEADQAADQAGDQAAVQAGGGHRFWWTTRHQEQTQKTVAMDMDALQRLFLELQDREEQNLRELRYVLCLLLMRKKRVKLERILRDDTGESFIVRRPKTEERYTVEVFDFAPDRMSQIREHLQAIFDGVDSDAALAAAARGEELDEQTDAAETSESETDAEEVSER